MAGSSACPWLLTRWCKPQGLRALQERKRHLALTPKWAGDKAAFIPHWLGDSP